MDRGPPQRYPQHGGGYDRGPYGQMDNIPRPKRDVHDMGGEMAYTKRRRLFPKYDSSPTDAPMPSKDHPLSRRDVLPGTMPAPAIAGGQEPLETRQVIIPDNIAGIIVGRNGDTLREIQVTSGAAIRIAEPGNPNPQERLITLTGTHLACERAQELIQAKMDEDALRKGRVPPPDAVPDARKNVEQIIIPSNAVGLVIGRGGETIRFIESQTGVHIQIDQEPYMGNPNERSVTLSGSVESITGAKAILQQKVNETADRAGPTTYPPAAAAPQGVVHPGLGGPLGPPPVSADAITVTLTVPPNAVGLIIGKQGATIHELQDKSGCRIQVRPDSESQPGSERPITLMGTHQQCEAAKLLLQEKVDEADQRTGPGSMMARSGFGQGIGLKNVVAGGPRIEREISIPNNMVGWIIGKRGATIMQLQDTSGARIQISQEVPGAAERTVTLVGTEPAVDACFKMVQAKLDEQDRRMMEGPGHGRDMMPPMMSQPPMYGMPPGMPPPGMMGQYGYMGGRR